MGAGVTKSGRRIMEGDVVEDCADPRAIQVRDERLSLVRVPAENVEQVGIGRLVLCQRREFDVPLLGKRSQQLEIFEI